MSLSLNVVPDIVVDDLTRPHQVRILHVHRGELRASKSVSWTTPKIVSSVRVSIFRIL